MAGSQTEEAEKMTVILDGILVEVSTNIQFIEKEYIPKVHGQSL